MEKPISDLTCRVCLNVEELMVNIYEEVEDLNSDLSTLLELCGDLKVDRADSFPKYLCKECTSELLIAAKFREKCSRTKEILQHYETELCALIDATAAVADTDLGECVSQSVDEEEINKHLDAVNVVNEPLELDRHYTELPTLNIKTEQTLLLPLDYFSSVKLQRNKNSLLTEATTKPIKNYSFDAINTENTQKEQHAIADGNIYFDEADLDAHLIDLAEAAANGRDISEQEVVAKYEEELQSNMPNINLKFVCDICGAAFANATNLQRHVSASHVPLQLFTCAQCKHCYSVEENFREHCTKCFGFAARERVAPSVTSIHAFKQKPRVRRNTQSKSDESKICTYCQKDCKTFFALNMHLRTHTGERPFSCEMCQKSFKTRSTLTAHVKRHGGQPDYICPYCSKTFYESTNLQAHIRTHTGEKPHACTLCEKRFTRVFLLQLHMRTHTGEKPYPCTLCSRSFAQLCDMKNHMRTHTGDRQFQCGYCPKSFIKRRQMLMHMQRHVTLEDINIPHEDTMQTSPTTADQTLIVEMPEDCGDLSLEYNLNDLIIEDNET